MPRPSLWFEVIDEGTRLRMLRTQLESPRFILEGIGSLLEAQTAAAFREEAMGKVRWKKRSETGMVPNWPAILAWFTKSAGTPPNRMFGDQHTLQGTGHLAGSFRSRVVSQDTVETGTTVPYASVLHAGGESETDRITKQVQDRIRNLISKTAGRSIRARASAKTTPEKKAAAGKRATLALQLQWLLHPNLTDEKKKITHPARPLVGVPEQLAADIEGLYGVAVGNA